MNEKKHVSGSRKNRVMTEICRPRQFENYTAIPYDTPSGFAQLRYITGYTDLFERFGMYADKTHLDYLMLTCLLTDNRDSAGIFNTSENEADIISATDDVIEFLMAKQLTKMPKRNIYTISLKTASLDIPKDTGRILYDVLEEVDFQKQPSFYIRREPYKKRYSVSAFAPVAHILLALKLRTKREDAKKQFHSVYYWGNLSYVGKGGQDVDFSQYFTISDYWYYEMNTGINLCVEIAAALQDLLDQKVIDKADIRYMCVAIKNCLHLVNQYPLLTRICLLRNCIQYGSAYMKAARQHPSVYIIQKEILKSPIKGNGSHFFEHPIRIQRFKDKPRKNSKKASGEKLVIYFTSEQLSWVFSEILHTVEIPFCLHTSETTAPDEWLKCVARHCEFPPNYPIAKNENLKCALAFCNENHRNIQDYLLCAKTYSKNARSEKMFYKVHSILFETIGTTVPKNKKSSRP